MPRNRIGPVYLAVFHLVHNIRGAAPLDFFRKIIHVYSLEVDVTIIPEIGISFAKLFGNFAQAVAKVIDIQFITTPGADTVTIAGKPEAMTGSGGIVPG